MHLNRYAEMYNLEQTHFWFVGKRLFIQKALETLPPKPRTILDVGTSTGGTTAFLSGFGSVIGLEKNTVAIRLARKRGINVVLGSTNRLPFRNASFDLVTFFDVLYHKGINEKKALREAYRILKPGGSILITDCALPLLWSQHDIDMEAKYRYTKQQLSKFVDRAGFHIEHCKYIFTSLFPLFILRRFVYSKSTSLPSSHINTMLITLLRLEASLPLWLPKPLGSSILILAKKI